MERINLNIPEDARRELKRVAKARGKTESEVARQLLLEGLERVRREAVYDEVERAQTPVLRERLVQMARAFERLDHDE